MTEETKKIDVGGYALRVRILGEGEEAFVLVPGFAHGTEVWDGIAPSLGKRGRVALVEQRGHGFSGGPDGPYQWDDLGKDLLLVMDDLAMRQATLIGHDLGGLACLLAARQAPDRVDRLIVIGTAAQADATQENWYHEIVKAGRMNALQGIAHAIYGPISRQQIDGTAKPLIELAKLMETLHKGPITARMAAVSCPTLVLAGEKDARDSASLAKALPNATLQSLPERGHSPHTEDAAVVVAAIDGFLGR